MDNPPDSEPLGSDVADANPRRRALVVGVGLIGGSIGAALRRAGWHVQGRDVDEAGLLQAVELGAIDEAAAVDGPVEVDLTFVATPVGAIADEVRRALADTTGLVTDAGSVKAPLVELMADPRYVGGHPMAGSEQEGVAGARADLFEGRTWVLTPVAGTDDDAFAEVRAVVAGFGAEVVSLAPERHDSMVALVSHVPHLTAASLMGLADESSAEHRGLMRLAAGGFRDMTRIAAGHPGIWPDICAENRAAIVAELDRLVATLGEVRGLVDDGDRDGLVAVLERARSARLALPARFARAEDLAEIRVPVRDQTGALAGITTLATELDVSIVDIEIAHSVEGDDGVVILLVEARLGERLRAGLSERGYSPVLRPLEVAEER
ncbi:MAG TPA: prephenate dehydrogenase/arogenate dehydrogenase family protein [Acidimicrobiales bacterium]